MKVATILWWHGWHDLISGAAWVAGRESGPPPDVATRKTKSTRGMYVQAAARRWPPQRRSDIIADTAVRNAQLARRRRFPCPGCSGFHSFGGMTRLVFACAALLSLGSGVA